MRKLYVMAVCAIGMSVHAQEILKNGSFENWSKPYSVSLRTPESADTSSPMPWKCEADRKEGEQHYAAVKINREIFHSGKASAELTSKDRSRGVAVTQYEVAIAPDTEYEASFWCKGVDIAEQAKGKGITVVVTSGPEQFWKPEKPNKYNYQFTPAEGSFDWQKVSLRFKTRPGDAQVYFRIQLAGSGTLYVDSASIQKVEQ